MTFVLDNDNLVTSFAEYQDVVDADQRIFDENESLSDTIIDSMLVKSTERILNKLRSSDWWKSYYIKRSTGFTLRTVADLPPVDANKILTRHQDFTDLCVYTAMAEYILPRVSDFDDGERKKMGYYSNKAAELLGELLTSGDWYDFDGNLTIESTEKQPSFYNPRRIR